MRGPHTSLDLGQAHMRTTSGEEYTEPFLTMAGIGRDALAVQKTGIIAKKRTGWAAYALTGMVEALRPAIGMDVQLDDCDPVKTSVLDGAGRQHPRSALGSARLSGSVGRRWHPRGAPSAAQAARSVAAGRGQGTHRTRSSGGRVALLERLEVARPAAPAIAGSGRRRRCGRRHRTRCQRPEALRQVQLPLSAHTNTGQS